MFCLNCRSTRNIICVEKVCGICWKRFWNVLHSLYGTQLTCYLNTPLGRKHFGLGLSFRPKGIVRLTTLSLSGHTSKSLLQRGETGWTTVATLKDFSNAKAMGLILQCQFAAHFFSFGCLKLCILCPWSSRMGHITIPMGHNDLVTPIVSQSFWVV